MISRDKEFDLKYYKFALVMIILAISVLTRSYREDVTKLFTIGKGDH